MADGGVTSTANAPVSGTGEAIADATGEETGELEKMLAKIADFYEDEVDAAVQSLTSIVEPIMMIGVGIMVGIIIIAMYMPMFKMLTLVK